MITHQKLVDYNYYNKRNLLDSKYRMLLRFKRNKIKINVKKNSKCLIFGSLDYYQGVRSLGDFKIYATENCNKPYFFNNNVKFKKSRLNKLDYKDQYFDFIFCNGILSHLKNHNYLIKEIYRVLKKKGSAWLNVYGDSRLTEMKNKLCKKFNIKTRTNLIKILEFYNWDSSKINFIVELLNNHNSYFFKKKKFELLLKKIGFTKIKFCTRGSDSDLTEIVFKNPKLKKILNYGDLRYILCK